MSVKVEFGDTIVEVSIGDGAFILALLRAQAQAIADEKDARNTAIAAAIANLIGSAPGALDTLNELANAFNNDPNFAVTVANGLAAKLALDGSATMGGALKMGGNRVTGVSSPVAGTDAATKGYADGLAQTEQNARSQGDATRLPLDGSKPMGADLPMDGNRPVGMGNPTAPDHGVRKAYSDLRNLGRPAPVATFGDSRSFENGPTPSMLYNTGYAAWAEIFTGGRVTFPTSLCFGVGGNTTAQMLARVDAVIEGMQAAGSEVVAFLGSTNDVPIGGLTAAETIANIGQIYAAFYAAGIKMIVVNELPRNDIAAPSGTGLQRRMQVRAFVQDVLSLQPGVWVVDPAIHMTDPAATKWAALPGFLRAESTPGTPDLLHCSVRGALTVGREVAAALNTLVPYRQRLAITGVDIYNAANAPRGNLLTNAMLQGSGPPSGGTGVVPDNWDALVDNGAGLTAVWSIVEIGNYRWAQVHITGTPTASDPRVRLQNSFGTAQLSAGDVLAGNVGLQLEAGSAGLRGIMAQTIINGNVLAASPATQANGMMMGPEPILLTSDGRLPTLCAPLATVPAGTVTSAVLSLNVALTQGVAADVTVRFGQPSLRKV